MAYPWAGFGGFRFRADEKPVYGSDVGWTYSPNVSSQRPFGTDTNVTTPLSIGSTTRTFEMYLSPDRLRALVGLLTTVAQFVDWKRPIPDARNAILLDVTPVEPAISVKSVRQDMFGSTNGSIATYNTPEKYRTRITLVSA